MSNKMAILGVLTSSRTIETQDFPNIKSSKTKNTIEWLNRFIAQASTATAQSTTCRKTALYPACRRSSTASRARYGSWRRRSNQRRSSLLNPRFPPSLSSPQPMPGIPPPFSGSFGRRHHWYTLQNVGRKLKWHFHKAVTGIMFTFWGLDVFYSVDSSWCTWT